MKIAIPTIILSFFLDSFISNIVPLNTNYFIPLFSLVAIILIYPYFNKNTNHYLFAVGILGLAYDIFYTDTLVLNLTIFLALGLLIKYVYSIFTINIVNSIIWLLVIIILYRTVTYIILILASYLSLDFMALVKSIYSSLILNVIYCLLGYYILDYLSYTFRIKKWD